MKVPPESADRSHALRVAVGQDGGWRTEQVAISGARTPAPLEGEAIVLDPYDDTWAVLIPDDRTVTALKTLLPEVTDPGLRAGIWNNLRSGFHNAAVSPADIVDIAVASFPVEDTEDTARRTTAWLFRDVVPLAPEGSLGRLHAATVAKIGSAATGSEQQLTAFRAAIRSAEDAEVLRAWLAATPEGIELDLDLRWRILGRLATLGAVSRAELQAAYDAEPANDARVALTGALCSLPDAEAKAYAWSVFTGETDLPNYDVVAAGAGMWRGPEELTAPYVERFFAEVPGTVEVRSGWVLADAAEAFFPGSVVTPGTLERAREVIDLPGLDLSLRRVLVDAADQLARQLTVKKAFPA